VSRVLPSLQNTKICCGFFESELRSLEERSGSNIDNKYRGYPNPSMGVLAILTSLRLFVVSCACRDAIGRTWIDCSATPVSSTVQDGMTAFQSDFLVRREVLYIAFAAIFINYEVFIFVSFEQSRL
jgi:hypothetical protein